MGQPIPLQLVELARAVAEKTAAEIHFGGSVAYGQLVASELYEALQQELSDTPRTAPGKRGVLAAAIDQCRRSANAGLSPPSRAAELRAVVDLLQSAASIRVEINSESSVRKNPTPRFRVIQGGLS